MTSSKYKFSYETWASTLLTMFVLAPTVPVLLLAGFEWLDLRGVLLVELLLMFLSLPLLLVCLASIRRSLWQAQSTPKALTPVGIAPRADARGTGQRYETEGPLEGFRFETEEQWREFRIGAWLHDCGKVTRPEHIVDKATKLETVYNRIHEIRMRFEVLLPDARNERLAALAAGEPPEAVETRHAAEVARLQEEFTFLAEHRDRTSATAIAISSQSNSIRSISASFCSVPLQPPADGHLSLISWRRDHPIAPYRRVGRCRRSAACRRSPPAPSCRRAG